MMQGIRRENTDEERQTWTFPVIVDEDVATYIAQEGIIDVNGYMNKLLHEERKRQLAAGKDPAIPGNQNLDELMSCTPDTSGYPEMQGHFNSGDNNIT